MDSVELRKDVFAHFGAAMYYAQCLEQSMILIIMFVDHFPKSIETCRSREEWEGEIESFLDDASSKTMGRLLGALKRINFPSSDLAQKLQDALGKRNFLAHHYFSERALEITTDQGCIKMVRELEEIQAFYVAIESHMNAVIEELSQKYGLTNELKASIMNEMMAEHLESL